MSAQSPSPRQPAVLVQTDARDVRLYEGLIDRGYRLFGFPPSIAAILVGRGMPIVPVDFSTRVEQRAASRAIQVHQAMLPELLASLADPSFAGWLGMHEAGDSEVVRDYLTAYARSSLLPEAAASIEQFHLLAEREDVRLVMVRDDVSRPMKPVIRAAQTRGIPTLHLVHGTPFSHTISTEINAQVAAVYGTATQDLYLSCGNPPASVAVTGNPVWDGYREAGSLHERRNIKSSLGIDPDLPLVFFATTARGMDRAADYIYPDWPWQHFQAAARALGRVYRNHPFNLLVKLHPGETYDQDTDARYRRVARESGIESQVLVKAGHADARHIFACDVMVCIDSNIGIEAMLLDRPVVTVRLGHLFIDYLFAEEDAVLIARDDDAIAAAVEAALFDPHTQTMLARKRVHSIYRFNYLNDGLAFRRMLQVIDTLLDPAGAERRLAEGAPAPLSAALTAAQRESVGQQHVAQAQAALGDGRLDEAEYLAQRSRQFLSNASGASFLEAYVALQRGEMEAAAARFRLAIEAAPQLIVAYHGLAEALQHLGQHAEAVAIARQALDLDPTNVDSLLNLADLLLSQSRDEDARALLARASRLAPADAQIAELMQRLPPSDAPGRELQP